MQKDLEPKRAYLRIICEPLLFLFSIVYSQATLIARGLAVWTAGDKGAYGKNHS